MDSDLKISGDNPFYVSYRDWRLDDEDHTPTKAEQRVVFRWSITKHPCLGIEVVPIANSALLLNVRTRTGAPGQPIVQRRVPQKLKVMLTCKDCDCGIQSATIKYQMSTRGKEASSWGEYKISLSIICVGPQCDEEEIIIQQVSDEPAEHLYDISIPTDFREI